MTNLLGLLASFCIGLTLPLLQLNHCIRHLVKYTKVPSIHQ